MGNIIFKMAYKVRKTMSRLYWKERRRGYSHKQAFKYVGMKKIPLKFNKPYTDSDGDGVVNRYDCEPENYWMQDEAELRFDKKLKGSGFYSPEEDEITINPFLSKEEMEKTIKHELEHKKQQKTSRKILTGLKTVLPIKKEFKEQIREQYKRTNLDKPSRFRIREELDATKAAEKEGKIKKVNLQYKEGLPHSGIVEY